MKIRLAYALSYNNVFEKTYFGEADKYLIQDIDSTGMVFISEEVNPFKSIRKNIVGGYSANGESIVTMLKNLGVSVVVSRQFGKNIRMASQYFVPVIINKEEPSQVLEILLKHKNWLCGELENQPTEHSVFTINYGILKSKIK
jgi:predicted Fe-Mo cluster-binding NifX family protein